MRIINYRFGGEKKQKLPELTLALGFFDGVHLGHRELIRRAARRAKELSMSFGVFTFSSECPSLKATQSRIYSTEEKLELIEALGTEYAIVADFDSVSGLEPRDFVTRVLVSDLNCRVAATGYNFRFGKGASGDAEALAALMRACGRDCLTVEEQKYKGGVLSASAIRAALSKGDVRLASEMLGTPYHLTGRVEHGLGIGRKLGFPTINMPLPQGLPLHSGVYRTAVPVGNKLHPALTNVGVCPTLGERVPHAETTLLDFSGDLYGERLKTYFLDFIREEMSFSSPEALARQIERDREYVRSCGGDMEKLSNLIAGVSPSAKIKDIKDKEE